MKTLILCVDRDDDLGKKAGVESPIIGRRRNLDAAMALGLADPEDSDTNALLAALHLHDQELKRIDGTGDQVEVATITGHPGLGLKADRKLTAELDEVVALVRPDEAILVSDGAEDEQILPLLQSRVRVAHVHRSIVKQAPRLEGFYYILTRLLDDEKQAKRIVLPFGIILLVWGLAYLFKLQSYAWGATLAIAGFTLVVQAMKWEESVSRFFRDVGRGLRSGKVALLATLAAVVLLLWGGAQAWLFMQTEAPQAGFTVGFRILVFVHAFVPYVVSSLLVLIAGRLFDDWARRGRTHLGQWTAAFSLIAAYLILGVALAVVIDYLSLGEGEGITSVVSFDRVVQLAAGIAVALGGTLLARYVRSFVNEAVPRQQPR
jgi:putative membrane protein